MPSRIGNSQNIAFRDNIFQQLDIVFINNQKLFFSMRNRLEERGGENVSPIAYRYRTRFNLLLYTQHSDYAYSFYDEIFYNLNHPQWVSDKLISENRLFAGLRFLLSSKVALQVGYLNIFNINRNRTIINHNIAMQLNVTV